MGNNYQNVDGEGLPAALCAEQRMPDDLTVSVGKVGFRETATLLKVGKWTKGEIQRPLSGRPLTEKNRPLDHFTTG
jgi:hypothetical protein